MFASKNLRYSFIFITNLIRCYMLMCVHRLTRIILPVFPLKEAVICSAVFVCLKNQATRYLT